MARTDPRYGWIPDLPDQRDHLYAAAPRVHCRRLSLRPAQAARPTPLRARAPVHLLQRAGLRDRPTTTAFRDGLRHQALSYQRLAVLAVGYLERSQCFIAMNSWSRAWGDAGFFYMPYAYLCNPGLARDIWTVRTVEP